MLTSTEGMVWRDDRPDMIKISFVNFIPARLSGLVCWCEAKYAAGAYQLIVVIVYINYVLVCMELTLQAMSTSL